MNRLDFAGRTAVVTGGAAGIGLAVAQRPVDRAGPAGLGDRDAAALEKAAGSLAGGAHVEALDVADDAGVGGAAGATAAALGAIDVLVCSAGITGPNVPLA